MKKLKSYISLLIITLALVYTNNASSQTKLAVEQDQKIQELPTRIQIEKNETKQLKEVLVHEVDSVATTNTKQHQSSRYLIGESAFGVKKGKTMYQNIMGGLNTFGFGVSDKLTINLTTEVFSLLSGSFFVLNINPKYTFGNSEDKIRFGIGQNAIVAFESGDVVGGGTSYGVVTLGSEYKNITAGVGFAYSFENGYGDIAVLQLSGVYPITTKFSIMFDSFFTLHEGFEGYIAPTLRYNYKHLAIDLGVLSGDIFEGAAVPFLSVSSLF